MAVLFTTLMLAGAQGQESAPETANDVLTIKHSGHSASRLLDRMNDTATISRPMPPRSRDSIQAVVNRHIDRFRLAYHKRLTERPGLTTTMMWHIGIDKAGMVTKCRLVRTATPDKDLETASEIIWRSIDFGKADLRDEGHEFDYPLTFSP